MISEEERKKYVEFMYNPENEYFCINCVLHVNHTLFYRKFKNIKRYTEHLL